MRLFAVRDKTFSLGVSRECRKQHSQRHLGQLFCEGRAVRQSHHGGTKGCLVASWRKKAQERAGDFKVLGRAVSTFYDHLWNQRKCSATTVWICRVM